MNGCGVLKVVAIIAAAALVGAGESRAQETFSSENFHAASPAAAAKAGKTAYAMGPLGPLVTYGSDGTWLSSAAEDGSLVVSSVVDNPGWSVVKHAAPKPPYSLDVRVHSEIPFQEGYARGAGVIIGFENKMGAKGRVYYVAYLADDRLFVASYSDNGDSNFNILSQGDGVGLSSDGFAKLRVDVDEKEFTVRAEGMNSLTFTNSADWPLTGDYGIFVSGKGRATFRDLYLH